MRSSTGFLLLGVCVGVTAMVLYLRWKEQNEPKDPSALADRIQDRLDELERRMASPESAPDHA